MVEFLHPYGPELRIGYQGPKEPKCPTDITLRAPISFVEIALFDEGDSTNKALKAHARLSLPKEPLCGIAYSDGHIFRIAKNRYFVETERPDLATKLSADIPSDQASIIDQSHGRVAIDLNGAKVETILAKLYALDFHKTAFSNNTGLATSSHGIHTLIWRASQTQFTLYLYRSFARSFLEVLQASAMEFGFVVMLEE